MRGNDCLALFSLLSCFYMDTATYKEKLLDEKTRLEKGLAEIGRRTGTPDDWEAVPEDMNVLRSDTNEVADEVEEYQTRIAINEEFEDRLAEITSALQRIENNTYGTCSICNAAIEEDRLSANPAAATCKAHINM